jgi:hypothetical protein
MKRRENVRERREKERKGRGQKQEAREEEADDRQNHSRHVGRSVTANSNQRRRDRVGMRLRVHYRISWRK